ncbi:hypothetical protein ACHAWF_005946, partial [Thalassiosira exigua]
VFVVEALHNGRPVVSVAFEGPVAGNDILVPRRPEDDAPPSAEYVGKETLGRAIKAGIVSDWPKLDVYHNPRGVVRREVKVDWTHAGESEDAEAAREEVHARNYEEAQRWAQRHKVDHKDVQVEDRPPLPIGTIPVKSIRPYEETFHVTSAGGGWYRLCATSELRPIVVELDLRRSDEMRGIDPGTGHVFTRERRRMMDEQVRIAEMEDVDRGIQKESGDRPLQSDDFEELKQKLKYIHELTSEVVSTQNDRMARLRARDRDARRGAAALARSSKVETLLYVGILVVQVYTVNKWLLGSLPLGK